MACATDGLSDLRAKKKKFRQPNQTLASVRNYTCECETRLDALKGISKRRLEKLQRSVKVESRV